MHASRQHNRLRIGRFLGISAVVLLTSTLPAQLCEASAVVERIAASPAGESRFVLPSAESAEWRVRTQLVWNPAENRLERRRYLLFDVLAAEELDFQWTPDAVARDRPGPISGSGTIVWRLRGAPSYDRDAAVARYRGEVREGRPHGKGEYLHRSGLSYRGEWRDGVMEGEGRLSLPNGDQYAGGFRAGRLHGAGIYVDATGHVYDGSFAHGRRHGTGVVSPPLAAPYRAVWRAGSEVADSRRPLSRDESTIPSVSLTRFEQHEGLRIGVIVERRPSIEGEPKPPLQYTFENAPDVLRIFPDEQRILDVWRGVTPINLRHGPPDWEENEYIFRGGGFLATAGRIRPVPLLFEFENATGDAQRIIGAYLEVADSRTELEPAIHVRVGLFDRCIGDARRFSSEFHIENFGWSEARNARIRLRFASLDGTRRLGEISRHIGPVSRQVTVDLIEELRRLGVDDGRLAAADLPCASGDAELCLVQARASGLLGELADLVTLDHVLVRIGAVGSLEYEWQDASGREYTKQSPFVAKLLLGQLEHQAECGEGGEPEELRRSVFSFDLDRADYRIAIPLREDVPAGVTARWRLELRADKSSQHDFRIVLRLADGREVASRPINLLYFAPVEPVTD